MKKILLMLLVSSLLICVSATTSEVYIPSETIGDFGYLSLYPTNDLTKMKEYIEICDEHKLVASAHAEQAREMKITNETEYIKYCSDEWWNAHNTKILYQNKVIKFETYYNSSLVWYTMKDFGWSDDICAGILGNMMRECGGDSLNINPYTQNSHYGLCQWSRRYHPDAWGKDITGQLQYLQSTLDLDIFKNCNSPEEVAEVFCWKYERPAPDDPVHKRRNNARIAYNYFTN